MKKFILIFILTIALGFFLLGAIVFLTEKIWDGLSVFLIISAILVLGIIKVHRIDSKKTKLNVKINSNTKKTISDSDTKTNHIDLNGFIGFCHGILADNKITTQEAILLKNYMSSINAKNDNRIKHILTTLNITLNDNLIDEQESEELKVLLSEFIDSFDNNFVKSNQKPNQLKPIKKSNEAVIKNIQTKNNESLYKQNKILDRHEQYLINYKDSIGATSEREILVFSTKQNKKGNYIVYAKCLKANSNRSFRLDRITCATNTSTGEILF